MHASALLQLLGAPPDDLQVLPPAAVVMPHPDDETVGAASRLPLLCHAAFIYVTDGAPRDMRDARDHGFSTRQQYAAARLEELHDALSRAGIAARQIQPLGRIDQEASLDLSGLSLQLADLLDKLRPSWILAVPYEGGHPDHDATAFAVHAACRLLRHRAHTAPAIIEMTSYHNSPAGLETSTFLPNGTSDPLTLRLSEEEQHQKRQFFNCYHTQRHTLSYFPIDIERFRLAPDYDFTQPPHPGTLYYELYPWGMTGERFRQLARRALDALAIGGEQPCR